MAEAEYDLENFPCQEYECAACGHKGIHSGGAPECEQCGWELDQEFADTQDFLFHVRAYRHDHKIAHPKYRPTGGHR